MSQLPPSAVSHLSCVCVLLAQGPHVCTRQPYIFYLTAGMTHTMTHTHSHTSTHTHTHTQAHTHKHTQHEECSSHQPAESMRVLQLLVFSSCSSRLMFSHTHLPECVVLSNSVTVVIPLSLIHQSELLLAQLVAKLCSPR